MLFRSVSGAKLVWLWSSTSRKWWVAFGVLFLASYDFWEWDASSPFLFGLPVWVWYFVLLSVVQTVMMWIMGRLRGRHSEDGVE